MHLPNDRATRPLDMPGEPWPYPRLLILVSGAILAGWLTLEVVS